MRTIQDLRRDEKDTQSFGSRSGVIFFSTDPDYLRVFKILQLTVLDRVNYEAESDNNRIIKIPIYPARGLIKLEDGTLVAENIVTKDLYIKTKFYESSMDQVEKLRNKVLDENRKIDQLQVPIQDEEKIWLARNLSEQELAKYEVQKNSNT